jgi:hypothetical protein
MGVAHPTQERFNAFGVCDQSQIHCKFRMLRCPDDGFHFMKMIPAPLLKNTW